MKYNIDTATITVEEAAIFALNKEFVKCCGEVGLNDSIRLLNHLACQASREESNAYYTIVSKFIALVNEK